MSDPVELIWNKRPLTYWLNAIHDSDGETRWEAVDALRHLLNPSQSIPILIDIVENEPYWRARALAAHALFDIGAYPPTRPSLDPFLNRLVPALASALSDDSIWVQLSVAEALETLGRDAAAALPHLELAAPTIENADVYELVESAIRNIRGD